MKSHKYIHTHIYAYDFIYYIGSYVVYIYRSELGWLCRQEKNCSSLQAAYHHSCSLNHTSKPVLPWD